MKAKPTLACLWILASCCGRAMAQEPPPEYPTWETANGISGAGATADSDGDGISNGIEFVIGGDPSGPDSDSNSLLPTVTVDVDYLNFVFRRTEASKDFDPFVEYSSSLGVWIKVYPGDDGVLIVDAVDFFGPGVDGVTVRISRALASGTALFARLRVEITP